MTYRSIHQGPVLRISTIEALLVAAGAGVFALAVGLGAAHWIGATLDHAVAAITGALVR